MTFDSQEHVVPGRPRMRASGGRAANLVAWLYAKHMEKNAKLE